MKPGYAILFSMNQFQKDFVSQLFARGIMRKENNRFHILNSPPLKIIQKKDFLFLYSTDYTPKITYERLNGGYWLNNGSTYYFVLDQENNKNFVISLKIPIKNFLKNFLLKF